MTDQPRMKNPMAALLRRRELTGKAYKHAPNQEKKLAKKLDNGFRVPGSGRGRQKGDVRVPGALRIECKATQHKSFSITQDMLRKIDEAAAATGEVPIVQVDFLDDDGKITNSVIVAPIWVLPRIQQGNYE